LLGFGVFVVAGQVAFNAVHAALVPLLPFAVLGLILLVLFSWWRSRWGR
jgi:hypothetical protein